MDYLTISNWIFNILLFIVALLLIHFLVFSIVGIFAKKSFPKAKEQLKYGVIIPARNEEIVIGNLIESIRKNKYPQDKLDLFVIAHNCDDKTAEIARSKGAIVYEYNNPDECTMGYAFRHLFACIKRDYGISKYDGFFLFNADNILDEYYFEKMNDAFVAENKESVITSFRNSKNFGSNIMSTMYGLYFVCGCRLECRGRTALGCSTRVQGTGYVINSKVVENGWPYVTLTEDWEFTADQILKNSKIVFCDDAVFYDEQPTTFKVMWKQRLRWSKGHLLVFLTKFTELFKSLFTSKKKSGNEHKFSTYDIMINIMPICVITTLIFVLKIIFVAISPLFGFNWQEVYLNFALETIIFCSISYILMVLCSIVLFIIERKRIKNVSIPLRIMGTLLWPFFLFLSIPLEFVAIFTRNLYWSSIPHTDTTSFDKLNNKK